MKDTKSKRRLLDRIHTPHWLTFLLGVIFVLRVPSFFEPFSYGDEMIYLTLGEGIRKGLVLYRDIHDNKPPLLYFIAALSGNVFWFRVILAAWMMAGTVIFWKLVRALFPKNEPLHKVTVTVFAVLTTIPLLEGQTSNAELFMVVPTILAFYILLVRKLSLLNVFVSGILLSISALFKIPAAFDVGAIIFFWFILIVHKKLTLLQAIKNTITLFLGFAIPLGISIVWYASRGAFQDYLVGAFLQNIGYLSSWRPSDAEETFVARNAPLLVRSGVVLVGFTILTAFRKKLSLPFIFTTAWLLVSLFGATLSERPYPHYLIQAVPAASILVGILVAQKSIEQSLAIFPLIVAFFVPVYFKFWYYPTFPYYERFVRFAAGQTTKEEYFNSFGSNTIRNYEIAKLLVASTKPEDKVFVWGDSSVIYALSRRLPPIKYVATYHIQDFSSKEEVLKMIEEDKPKMVVVLPDSPSFSELSGALSQNYIPLAPIEGAVIWRLSSTKVK